MTIAKKLTLWYDIFGYSSRQNDYAIVLVQYSICKKRKEFFIYES